MSLEGVSYKIFVCQATPLRALIVHTTLSSTNRRLSSIILRHILVTIIMVQMPRPP